MPESLQTPDNLVRGCLSTVFVHATVDDSNLVSFTGTSDGLLTKGLVALLVDGLSGCEAAVIEGVEAEFVVRSGLDQSLTPGRNNGFLNMLALMKVKAREAADGDDAAGAPSGTGASPIADKMRERLAMLQPTAFTLEDVSHEHAGHAGAKGLSGESHFTLDITAACFSPLSSVKRHQLVYTVLGDVMDEIHALSIKARTGEEEGEGE